MVVADRPRVVTGTFASIDAGDYVVSVGPGLLSRAGEIASAAAPAHRFAVVSDSNVAPLYAQQLVAQLSHPGRPAALCTVAAGEEWKTRESWARITDELLAAGLGRDTTIVALGGGVVCDLAGFVAATFMRGVPVVHVPTTLLAMIDASIGGKTGVDTDLGKNLVGAFHQPSAVIIDAELLATLPAEELRSGMAEAIKHGAIADAAYFEFVSRECRGLLAEAPGKRDVPALNHVIETSVRLKVGFVAADERETGARKALNFGHTIGHAIETLSGYSVRHGEAVGIGMLLEATAAEHEGVAEAGTAERIRRALQAAGLPTQRPAGPSATRVLDSMRADKKGRNGRIEYAVPSRIGTIAAERDGFTVLLPDALVEAVLT
ncbi:MAG: 3-dehydroquinate synthase [Gemmatimonadota bacterium]|nr:3-dehydroquinate synthase [Gemmatimonadota bacterium]